MRVVAKLKIIKNKVSVQILSVYWYWINEVELNVSNSVSFDFIPPFTNLLKV